MKKYEYYHQYLDEEVINVGNILDRLGQDGWELVSVVQIQDEKSPTFYFKRELNEN